MDSDSLHAEKARVRREVREASAALPESYLRDAGRRIAAAVTALPDWKEAQVIMAYASMPREPDTAEIIREALKDGKTVLLPRCADDRRMEAFPVRDLSELKEGRMGIPEPPDAPAGEKIPQPDLILVPCVAAAMDGRRLGHGAGYYDRFLAGRGAKTFCLCFGRLLREDLPAGPEDIRMDAVVTEDGAVLLTEKRS